MNRPIRIPRLLSLVLFLVACSDSGTGPSVSDLEILIVQGDGQAAGPGTVLPVPLKVRVQKIDQGGGVDQVRVRWVVSQGAGANLDPVSARTDSTGVATTTLTLGPGLGVYRVRASVSGADSPPVEFTAEALPQPELTSVPEGPVFAGDTVVVEGRNFSPNPGQNVVTFSGIRGRAITAQALGSDPPSRLEVEVPSCLPSGAYQVRVRVGVLGTALLPVEIIGPRSSQFLQPGEDRILDASEALSCLHLPYSPSTSYLVVPHSTGTVGGGQYPFQLTGLAGGGGSLVSETSPVPLSASTRGSLSAGFPPFAPGERAQKEWEFRVRALEGELIRDASRERPPGKRTPADVLGEEVTAQIDEPPAIGDRREFKVLNRDNGFDRIHARVRTITDHALVYVDEQVPTGGFTDSDLAMMAMEFEDPVYPTITGAFGSESDLDGNGRVIILFTPAVNRLTEPGSDGFIGGFFFGLDLLEGRDGSNGGEIFYALVPDPSGEEGPPLLRTSVLDIIPAILAHEFEHMIHFNQRTLLAGASGQEALWLSEALAQMAEDLVGAAFARAYRLDKAYQYRVGNWSRARSFLFETNGVSLLASLSPGTLAERGAGWLFLKQVSERPGQDDLLRNLVGSTRTGIQNLTMAVGRDWASLVSDWVGGVYLDGLGVSVRPDLLVEGVDLRKVLSSSGGEYPLQAKTPAAGSFSYSGTLWSSAPDYFIIRPLQAGGLALSLSGLEGGPPDSAMGLRFLVVRLQ